MQMGMNTNVNHQGKILHIQTEDSGSEHPHIITHIFLSGQIIASERLEYKDFSKEALQQSIKKQHQQMIQDLSSGKYDKKILLARPSKFSKSQIPLARKKRSSTQQEEKLTPPISHHQSSLPLDPKVIQEDIPLPSSSKSKDNQVTESRTILPSEVSTPTAHPKSNNSKPLNLRHGGPWAVPRFTPSPSKQVPTEEDE